jgi:hypothetical protein
VRLVLPQALNREIDRRQRVDWMVEFKSLDRRADFFRTKHP